MLDHANDAHFYTFLANSISEFGQIKWIVTPMSYFGIYPFSSDTAYPLFLSAISQMAGVSLDTSLFFLTFSLSIMGLLGVFILLKKIFNTPIFVACGIFFYALAPIVVWRSSWSLTSRILAIYAIPFFLYFLMQTSQKEHRNSFLLLSGMSALLIFLSHKLAYFAIPLILAYFVSRLLIKTKNIVPKKVRKQSIIIWSTLLLIIFFASTVSDIGVAESYEQGIVIHGSTYIKAPINAIISLTGSANLILLFAPLGLLWILKKPSINKTELFVLLTITFTLPLLQFRVYTRPFISLFLIIFGLYGIYYLKEKTNRKIFVTILVSTMLLSIAFMGFLATHWASGPLAGNLFEDENTYSRFSCITYSSRMNYGNGTFIANFWGDARDFQSYINMPNVPVQHGVEVSNLLIYGYVSPAEVRSDTETISLSDIHGFIENEGPFYSQGLESYHIREIDSLMQRPKDSMYSTRLMESYNSQFILTNKAIGLKYLNRWIEEPRDSTFFRSVPHTSYKYYESDSFVIWTA